MSIKLQMTGTGNAFGKLFFNNNALIHSGGYQLMIDFGQTASLALYQMGVQLNQINGVLITHLHADHIGGLEELAFQAMYRSGHRKGKIQLFIGEQLVEPLWEHSLKAGLLNEKEGYTSLDSYFDVQIMQEGVPFRICEELTIELIRTEHIPGKTSYSLLLNEHIFYSADLIFDRSLLEHIVYTRHVDVILHDCQFVGKGIVHATLDELMTLPDDIQSLIYLMHYDDEMPKFAGRTGKMKVIQQHKLYTF